MTTIDSTDGSARRSRVRNSRARKAAAAIAATSVVGGVVAEAVANAPHADAYRGNLYPPNCYLWAYDGTQNSAISWSENNCWVSIGTMVEGAYVVAAQRIAFEEAGEEGGGYIWGVYDDGTGATKYWIESYQKISGLDPTGQVATGTWKEMRADLVPFTSDANYIYYDSESSCAWDCTRRFAKSIAEPHNWWVLNSDYSAFEKMGAEGPPE